MTRATVFALVGMLIMCAAADLILIFLGIELMSLSVYALVGLNRRSAHAAEGALKYFLLGAFASGFLLYGIALIYGANGSTDLAVIGLNAASGAVNSNLLMLAGMGLLLQANVSLIRALELNERMYQNLHLRRAINNVIDQLIKGKSFSEGVAGER